MTARHKLNSAHVLGAIFIGGTIGVLTQSWLACLVITGVLVPLALHDGGIRFG